ncbi:MAG: 30S ribosomal protein S7 [Legionellales bacterium]|nr:30S ribosomal protein S7 [Legionellales bacterium]
MRRRSAEKRPVIADPKYGDETISRFVNRLMVDGKKSVAERILYKALDLVVTRVKSGEQGEGEEGTGSGGQSRAVILLNKALQNVSPMVEVRSRRIGGATYQVPVEVPSNRRQALGIRWLIVAASKRGERGMILRLAAELADAVAGRGEAVKKREDTYRMAKANQAFAHFKV